MSFATLNEEVDPADQVQLLIKNNRSYAVFPRARNSKSQTSHERQQFMEWWQEKTWYQSRCSDAEKKKQIINWESRKAATEWSKFTQAAVLETGEPRVLCNLCDVHYTHPSIKGEGTGNMKKHLQKKHSTVNEPDLGACAQGQKEVR